MESPKWGPIPDFLPSTKTLSFSIYARKRPHRALSLQLRSWSQSWEPSAEMYANDELKGSDTIRESSPLSLRGRVHKKVDDVTWAVDWYRQRQEKSVYIPQWGTDEEGCVFIPVQEGEGVTNSMLIISVTSLLTQDCYQELS